MLKLFYLFLFFVLTLGYRVKSIPNLIKLGSYSYKTRTYIHLEKFNERFNLLHIGVSFVEGNKCARFDFRSAEEDQISFMTYSTNPLKALALQLFNKPLKTKEGDIYPFEFLRYNMENSLFETCDIYWGLSNRSLIDIINYEQSLNKRYILAFNDCRHYTRKLTDYALDKPTPIWKLNKLFNQYKFIKNKKKKYNNK
jgi:hypothetical protein